MRRRESRDGATLRRQLIGDFEDKCAGRPDLFVRHTYGPLLEKLRAGEPITVAGWRLEGIGVAGIEPWDHYLIDADSTITRLDRSEVVS